MKVFILIYLGLAVAHSGKILGIFHVASFSHFAPAQTLMNALVDRGYDVTVIAVYKNNDSKFKLIHLEGFEEAMDELKKAKNFFKMDTGGWIKIINNYRLLTSDWAKQTFEHHNVQALIKSDQKYDMVIMEHFGNEAFQGFCHHFNASCILYNAIPANTWVNPFNANPENPAYIPEIYLPTTAPMDFLTRLHNTIIWLFEKALYQFVILPAQNSLMQKHIPNAPHITDIIYNTDLIFLNSHESFSDPIPLTPNMIEIGGFHIKPTAKLPVDLQKFFDEAEEGVVYFSMGSVLNTRDITEEKRTAFLKAFGRLKQRVLWKFDGVILETPDNVKHLKWIPQKDVLAHPNLKLFITHGGVFSTIEAIYFEVPIIGIPIFGDQAANMIKCHQKGLGITLNYDNATEESIYQAIRTVLDNKMYINIYISYVQLKKTSRMPWKKL